MSYIRVALLITDFLTIFCFETFDDFSYFQGDVFEARLQLLEQTRMLQVYERLTLGNIKLLGYYHTSAWRSSWPSIIEEQLRLMDGTYDPENLEGRKNPFNGTCLLCVVDELYVTVSGTREDCSMLTAFIDSLDLLNRKKISIHFAHTIGRFEYRSASPGEQRILRYRQITENISVGEYSTIQELHSTCKKMHRSGQRTFVFYAHSKGVCCPKNSGIPEMEPTADWRETLNTFTIEYPSTCIRSLLDGYAACGANFYAEHMHFVGNMWWADCNHIAALPGLWDPLQFVAEHETFVLNTSLNVDNRRNFGVHCAYTPYVSPVGNHYRDRCPRSSYLPVLHRLLTSDNLPPNPSAIVTPYSTWAELTCSRAYERPYADQPSWVDSSQLWWRRSGMDSIGSHSSYS